MAEEWALSDDGLALALESWRSGIAIDSDYSYGLFDSDTHPVAGTVIGDYTEASFAGYLRATLTNSAYQAATVTGNVATSLSNLPVDFTVDGSFVGSVTIYGYLVFNFVGVFQWAFRFANPRVLFAFDRLSVTPKMRNKNTT